MFTVFQSSLGADKERAALIFWKLPSFKARLDYTSMLVGHYLKLRADTKKDQEFWNKYSSKLEKLHSFRNRLAHQPASEVVTGATDGEFLSIPEGMIIPNRLDPHKKELSPILLADLTNHLKNMTRVRKELISFLLTSLSIESILSLGTQDEHFLRGEDYQFLRDTEE